MTNGDWPSVAVVIPNHSRIAELEEALASVAAQDYPGRVHTYLVYLPRPEIEPLLACLGESVTPISSTDDDGRNPIAVKRNLGLRNSTEDLVSFLDDDDIWDPRKLSLQIEAMGCEPVAVAVASRILPFTDELIWPDSLGKERWRDFTRLELLGYAGFATSGMILRGHVARDLEFDERPEWFSVEDYEFRSRLLTHGPMRQMDGIHLGYRVTSTSTSESVSEGHPDKMADQISDAVLDAIISAGDRRAMAARTFSVLSEVVRRPDGWLAPRLVALYIAGDAIFRKREPQSQFSDDLLSASLSGRFFGPIDRVILLAVRISWRIGFDSFLLRRLLWRVMRGAQAIDRWRVRCIVR